MTIRCKFQLSEVHCFPSGSKKFIFTPQYDTTIPEDQRFAKASPSGRFEILVDNPIAQKEFEVGKYYYFDATQVPTPAAA